jgi:hypothetical protein
MLITIASLIAIAYLPGAVIFRLPLADRSKRAALPAEERLFWGTMLSVIVTMTVAFALAAIDGYSLSRLVWSNVVMATALALASRGNLRLGHAAPPLRRSAAIPAGLIALGAWMYFAAPAAEYVVGGEIPGAIGQGIQMRKAVAGAKDTLATVPAQLASFFSVLLNPALQHPFHGIPPSRP